FFPRFHGCQRTGRHAAILPPCNQGAYELAPGAHGCGYRPASRTAIMTTGRRGQLDDRVVPRPGPCGWDGDMDPRSRAREVALQLLYQRDLNPGVARDATEDFVRERLKNPVAQTFCLGLFDGTVEKVEAIDRGITEAAQNWRLPRMAGVDRNILRLGTYE